MTVATTLEKYLVGQAAQRALPLKSASPRPAAATSNAPAGTKGATPRGA
jgi:hypothetical protein